MTRVGEVCEEYEKPLAAVNTKDEGHSPGMIWLLTAGHSRRREANSGGEAECHVAHDFWGKAESFYFPRRIL